MAFGHLSFRCLGALCQLFLFRLEYPHAKSILISERVRSLLCQDFTCSLVFFAATP